MWNKGITIRLATIIYKDMEAQRKKKPTKYSPFFFEKLPSSLSLSLKAMMGCGSVSTGVEDEFEKLVIRMNPPR